MQKKGSVYILVSQKLQEHSWKKKTGVKALPEKNKIAKISEQAETEQNNILHGDSKKASATPATRLLQRKEGPLNACITTYTGFRPLRVQNAMPFSTKIFVKTKPSKLKNPGQK
jgi:hypothetical protein